MPEVADRPLVIGLGVVDPDLVNPVLAGHCRYVPEPTEQDLAHASGAIARADAVVDRQLLARTPLLRVVARTGVGVDRVDLDAATARGIAVVTTPGAGATAVAEGAIAMAMHLVKRFGRLTDLVRSGRWTDRGTVPVGDLAGSVLGVVGYGQIGRRVGVLGAALGLTVLVHDPVHAPPDEISCPDLQELVRRSDVITLHVPLLTSTRYLIGSELLRQVKPGVVLVNCGRGELIDIDAVHTALLDGRLGGVGLDVFEAEPPVHHPLFDHPDVVLTPHVMGLSRNATTATFADAARGVLDVLTGRPPAAVANPGWEHAATLSLESLEST